MAASRGAGPRQGDSAPIILIAGIVGALVLSYLRYPGFIALWLAFIAAPILSAPPQFTGPKDATGQPTAQGQETAQMLRYRRWGLLRRNMLPSPAWLPSTAWQNIGEQSLKPISSLGQRWPFLAMPLTVIRFVIPSRTATVAGLGAAAIVATLPVDSLPVHLWWLNAAAVYICVVGWDDAYRRTVAEEDVAPPVTVRDVAAAVSEPQTRAASLRTLVFAVVFGFVAGFGLYVGLRYIGLTWLIVPAQLAAAGAGVVVFAGVVHGGFRAAVIAQHKRMVQVRAEWAPRWMSLKEDVRLVSHEDFPGGGTLDVFEAPATLGATGAFGLANKLGPFLGSGVTFALLPVPNLDGQGNPVPGSVHPVRFRVVAFLIGSEPQVTDTDADPRELGLLAEIHAAVGVRTSGLGQQAEVPQVSAVRRVTTEDSAAVVWEAGFDNPVHLGDAADGIQAAFGTDAVALDQSILFGQLGSLDDCDFEDPGLGDQLAKMTWDRDWRRRWRDVFKSKEGKMVATPQHAAKQDLTLALPTGDVVLSYAPMMTRQGDKIADYMSPAVSRQVATTLRGAPFCTVTWYPSRFSPGERDEVAFAVIHASKDVPKDPTRIPASANRTAALWALTRSVNDAFDAARMPRPFVTRVTPMSSPRSRVAIWKIGLRLYDGATLDLVKRAAPKLRLAMGSPAWLVVTGGDDGATLYAGAHPAAEDVVPASRATANECQVADLESAFTDAGLDSPFDGSTPQQLEVGQLPENEQVTRMVFSVPTGRAISDFQVSKAIEKMKTATGNKFFDVRQNADPARFEVLVSREDPMPSPAPFQWDSVDQSGYRSIPFGSRVEGAPCVWDLSLDSHVLVLGSNGSGKGIAMTAMLAPMLMHGWDVYCADPIKGFNDFGFADPWLHCRCTTYAQTAALMKHIIGILEERKQLNARHNVSNVRDLPDELRPPMVGVFIDEFTSLVIPDPVKKPAEGADEVALNEYAQASQVNSAKEVIAAALGRVVREGRATGVAMVVAGQKLTSDIMSRIPGGSTIKDLALDTRVPVPVSAKFPSGWARNDELEIGDSIYSIDGTTSQIVKLSEVFESNPTYRVTFDDGQSVVAGEGHLWLASDWHTRRMHRRQELEGGTSRDARLGAAFAVAHTMPTGTWLPVSEIARMFSYTPERVLTLAKEFGLERMTRNVSGGIVEHSWAIRGGQAPRTYDVDEVLAAASAIPGLEDPEAMARLRPFSGERLNARELASVALRAPESHEAGREVSKALSAMGIAGQKDVRPRPANHETTLYEVTEFASMLARHLEVPTRSQDGQLPPLERVVTTREMAETMVGRADKNESNWTVRVADAIDGPDDNLPIDPYVLGAWIGDGNSDSAIFTQGQGAACTDAAGLTDQAHLIDQLTAAGYEGHVLGSGDDRVGTRHLQKPLRLLGLLGRRGSKLIPASYLRASIPQRLALLQGLMDTDGTVTDAGECIFAQAGKRIATQVAELARSLGIRAYLRRVPTPGVGCGEHFVVSFTKPHLQVFRLPRKARRLAPSIGQSGRQAVRRIVSIERIPSVPTRCIGVDHPDHMFLVEDFIPTHNSQFSRLAMGKMSFGDMSSAFNDAQSAMGLLGPSVPRGRGIFESTSEAAFAVQTWWGGGSQADHFAQIIDRVSAVRAPLSDADRIDFTVADREAQTNPGPRFGQVKNATTANLAPVPVQAAVLPEDEEIAAVIEGDGLGLDFGFDDEPQQPVWVSPADDSGLGLSFDDDDDDAEETELIPHLMPAPSPVPMPVPIPLDAPTPPATPPVPRADHADLFPQAPPPTRMPSDVTFD